MRLLICKTEKLRHLLAVFLQRARERPKQRDAGSMAEVGTFEGSALKSILEVRHMKAAGID